MKAKPKGLELSEGKKYWRKFHAEMKKIDEALARKRKDRVVTLRLNSFDLGKIKTKAARLGMKYQTFISEILHRVATKD